MKALIVHFLAKVVVCQQCCADSTCDGERGSEVYARYKCVCVTRAAVSVEPQPKKNQQTYQNILSVFTQEKKWNCGYY